MVLRHLCQLLVLFHHEEHDKSLLMSPSINSSLYDQNDTCFSLRVFFCFDAFLVFFILREMKILVLLSLYKKNHNCYDVFIVDLTVFSSW